MESSSGNLCFFSGSGLKYYINGDLSGSQTNPSSYSHKNNYNDFRIAKSSSDQNAYGATLQMKFDQLATWNRILNSQEIQIAFNQGRLKNFKLLIYHSARVVILT